MTVRRAVPGDEPTLRAVRLEAVTESPDQFLRTLAETQTEPAETWARWIRNGAVFLAEVEGATRGLTCGVPHKHHDDVAYLVSVWLHPELRGSGLADELVGAAIAWARQEGFATMRLDVMEDNGRARRFYERLGFVATGRIAPRARDGAREVEMDLPLDGGP